MFLGSFGRAVKQTLGIITGHNQLNRAKECLDEFLLLIADVLSYTLRNRDNTSLELEHAKRDTIHVKDDIRSLSTVSTNSHFFSNSKMIVLRILPINRPDGLIVFSQFLADFDAIAKQAVCFFVEIIQAHLRVVSRLFQFANGFLNKSFAMSSPSEE